MAAVPKPKDDTPDPPKTIFILSFLLRTSLQKSIAGITLFTENTEKTEFEFEDDDGFYDD